MKQHPVLTLLYHEVVDRPEDSGFQTTANLPYKHKVREFKDNLDIVDRLAPKVGKLESLEAQSSPLTLISFDDGGASSMKIADELESRGHRGIFFITTSILGTPGFLTEKNVRELFDRGHTIGSHSHTHPNVFRSLSYKDMLFEWRESKKILEQITESKITVCSIPGGDASDNAYTSAVESGYSKIFDSEPEILPRHFKEAQIYGRVCPKAGTALSEIEKTCRLQGFGMMKLKRRTKLLIKAMIFPIYLRIRRGQY